MEFVQRFQRAVGGCRLPLQVLGVFAWRQFGTLCHKVCSGNALGSVRRLATTKQAGCDRRLGETACGATLGACLIAPHVAWSQQRPFGTSSFDLQQTQSIEERPAWEKAAAIETRKAVRSLKMIDREEEQGPRASVAKFDEQTEKLLKKLLANHPEIHPAYCQEPVSLDKNLRPIAKNLQKVFMDHGLAWPQLNLQLTKDVINVFKAHSWKPCEPLDESFAPPVLAAPRDAPLAAEVAAEEAAVVETPRVVESTRRVEATSDSAVCLNPVPVEATGRQQLELQITEEGEKDVSDAGEDAKAEPPARRQHAWRHIATPLRPLHRPVFIVFDSLSTPRRYAARRMESEE